MIGINVKLFIPLCGNDGAPFDDDHHTCFEDHVTAVLGGITILPSEASGKWSDGDRVYVDTHRIYSVCLPSILQGGLLGEVVQFASAHYEQEAIYIEYFDLVEIV